MEQINITDYTIAACTIFSAIFTAIFSLITLINTIRRNSEDDYNEVHKLLSDSKGETGLRRHPINSPLNEILIRNWINSKIARYHSPFGNIITSAIISLLSIFLLLIGLFTIFSLYHKQYKDFFIELALTVGLILTIAIILNSPSFSTKITIERRMYIDYLSSIGIEQQNPIQRLIPMFSRKHPASLYWNSLHLQSTIELLEQIHAFAKRQSLDNEWINQQIIETQRELDSKLYLLKTKPPEAFCALMFITDIKPISDQPQQITRPSKTKQDKIRKKRRS